MFRPFPADLIKKALAGKDVIGVFDRSAGLGSEGGPVWNEARSALLGTDAHVLPFIGGLGGRDVPPATIKKVFNRLLDIHGGKKIRKDAWIDVKENPMDMREVLFNV
jgi:pyruvate ferredoxin oxidoreductase alpha subunit